ncbi:ribonuclease J [Thomasclavelia spiroformis]|uniref:ribonuclease J n=1 Tax=Thomasclavelia spiroformis TaxID=29348 RepID=UPI0024B0997F|nr:ribonuclease J [Thomasclavelia spiroformis]
MRKDIVKILPLGGQAEMGKSMYCIEIKDKIFILDAGFRFPEINKLGIDIIIPSFDYLKENASRVVAIIITHGHDDVMGALPYLLEAVNAPIYAPALTADLIDQMLKRHKKHNNFKINYQLNRVKRNDSIEIEGVPVEFFPVTHSIPGSVGVALWTRDGYIVYCGEFIIDFGAPEGFRCDIQKMMEIGKKGVLALLCESSYSKNSGYTSPKHKLTDKIDNIFEDSEGRIIISSYAQNIFRTKEIVELTKKYSRKIVFYGRDKYDSTNSIVRIGQRLKKAVINIPKEIIAFSTDIGKKGIDDDLVVLLSGTPQRIYHDINDIIDGGDEYLKLNENDTFIVASPVVPGTEKIANRAINELYKTDSNIHVLKNKELTSMHASQEDVKVIIQIFNPTYFIPIKGEYQHFISNMEVAMSMQVLQENIPIIDNGEILTFKNGVLEDYRDTIEVEDVMIDGIGVGDVGDKVIDDRIQLSNDGVVVIGVTIDSKKREIIANTDVQSRGFVYLKDSEHIIKGVIDIAEKCVAQMKGDYTLEAIEVRQEIKDKASKYITKETGKRPVILPIIIEV